MMLTAKFIFLIKVLEAEMFLINEIFKSFIRANKSKFKIHLQPFFYEAVGILS